jgi:hypothetical protein
MSILQSSFLPKNKRIGKSPAPPVSAKAFLTVPLQGISNLARRSLKEREHTPALEAAEDEVKNSG